MKNRVYSFVFNLWIEFSSIKHLKKKNHWIEFVATLALQDVLLF